MCRELYISRALSHHIFWHKSHRKNPVTCRRPTAGVRRVLKGRILLTETPTPLPPATANFVGKTIQMPCPRETFAPNSVGTSQSYTSPSPHISPAAAGAVWDSIRADKAPAPNPISCESKRCCLSVTRCWVICTATRNSWRVLQHVMKKRNCILGHPGIFFCGGVETHIFLTRERAARFPVRACVSDPPSSYCMCVIVKLWLRYLDAVTCNG